MQIENTRQLHLMLGKGTVQALGSLNAHQFKKKYPGEHVALVREEDRAQAELLNIFSEVHTLNVAYLQRSSFSPLLGDEIAFNHLHQSLAPLVEQKWTRLFNSRGRGIDSALSELFKTQQHVGVFTAVHERKCQEPTLKLQSLLDQWGMGHPTIQKWLLSKAYGQLDWTGTELALQKIIETKHAKNTNGIKNITVGINVATARIQDEEKFRLLDQLFTVIDLNAVDEDLALFVDFIVTPTGMERKFWNYAIKLEQVDTETLSNLLPDALSRNLVKWTALSALFDYLGNARAALASEKILSRYDREALQTFLIDQVLALKAFARILLDGLRKQGSEIRGPLEAYWASSPGSIAFTSAIELSLHSSVIPLLRNDQDVLAVKKRMRTLNQFYERLHRATALEIPKTDLELTL